MNDLISREAVIDSIYKNHMNGKEGVKQDLENLYGSAVCFSETLQDAVESIEELPTVPAIPIPDNATNGDVIKAIFSDNVFAEERWQDENGKMCTDVISDNGMTFTDIWWNSPYKRGDTDE